MQRACWCLLMVLFHTFWVQTDVTFFAFENGPSSTLLTLTIFWFTFHNHIIQGIKFYTCPCYSRGVERLCWLVLLYFLRVSSTSSCKNFNNGILFPWILQNNLQEVMAVALSKWKKATTTFWNGFAHDKFTRTGQVNQHLPYLHCTPWKDLALVRLYGFPQLSNRALLTKLDLATNSWWQQ